MRHAAGISGMPACEGMFIKRGSLRSFKKTSHHAPPADPTTFSQHTDTTKSQYSNNSLGNASQDAGSYNGFQRVLRATLGLDRMEQKADRMEQRLDYLYRNGLVRDDLHEIGVVMDARRGIFLPANMITDIITSSAYVHVAEIIGKKSKLFVV